MDTSQSLYRWAAGLIIFICITAILVYTKTLLVPLTLALFLFALASNSIEYLDRHFKLPRNVALSLVIGGSFVGTFLLGLFLVVSFRDFFMRAEEYTTKLTESLYYLQSKISSLGFGIDLTSLPQIVNNLPLVDWIKNFSGSFVSILGELLLVLVFFIFLVFGGDDSKNSHSKLWVEIRSQINRYIVIKVVSSLITIVFVWLLLTLTRVDLAFPIAILSGALNFLPNIGAAISVFIPLPLAFLEHGFGVSFWTVLIGGSFLQFSIGSFLETKLLKDSIDFNPIAILLSLLFWGIVWGIAGMFLAIPIMLALKTIFAKNKNTLWISDLVSGKL
jgi:AI-2 transport protein TqsA